MSMVNNVGQYILHTYFMISIKCHKRKIVHGKNIFHWLTEIFKCKVIHKDGKTH